MQLKILILVLLRMCKLHYYFLKKAFLSTFLVCSFEPWPTILIELITDVSFLYPYPISSWEKYSITVPAMNMYMVSWVSWKQSNRCGSPGMFLLPRKLTSVSVPPYDLDLHWSQPSFLLRGYERAKRQETLKDEHESKSPWVPSMLLFSL